MTERARGLDPREAHFWALAGHFIAIERWGENGVAGKLMWNGSSYAWYDGDLCHEDFMPEDFGEDLKWVAYSATPKNCK